MTAKRARKSPSRLTTWAYQTRRITVTRRTSRNVIGAGGVAVAMMTRDKDHSSVVMLESASMRLAWGFAAICLIGLTVSFGAQQTQYDLLLRHGRIVDGTGSPWFSGDIAIRGDAIVKIAQTIDEPAARVIDVPSEVIAP